MPALLPATVLTINGAAHRLALARDDFGELPRAKATMTDHHTKQRETYEGVLVTELLRKAGAPRGEARRRRLRMVNTLTIVRP